MKFQKNGIVILNKAEKAIIAAGYDEPSHACRNCNGGIVCEERHSPSKPPEGFLSDPFDIEYDCVCNNCGQGSS